jgi:hypothetical protein
MGVVEPPPWPLGVALSHPQNLYIYKKEIIKIIIKKNDSHVSAEVYHGDRCHACTLTPVG